MRGNNVQTQHCCCYINLMNDAQLLFWLFAEKHVCCICNYSKQNCKHLLPCFVLFDFTCHHCILEEMFFRHTVKTKENMMLLFRPCKRNSEPAPMLNLTLVEFHWGLIGNSRLLLPSFSLFLFHGQNLQNAVWSSHKAVSRGNIFHAPWWQTTSRKCMCGCWTDSVCVRVIRVIPLSCYWRKMSDQPRLSDEDYSTGNPHLILWKVVMQRPVCKFLNKNAKQFANHFVVLFQHFIKFGLIIFYFSGG